MSNMSYKREIFSSTVHWAIRTNEVRNWRTLKGFGAGVMILLSREIWLRPVVNASYRLCSC